MNGLVLGVDVGTTSAKCLAVDEAGRPVGWGQHAYALSHPHPGWAEQDPEELWQGMLAAIRACLHELGGRASGVRALALSTQADTLIPCDAHGRALRPALSWMDSRAQAEHAALLAEAGRDFWYGHTRFPLSPVSSACKIRWLAAHEPDLHPARWCAVPDYLAARLCGRWVTDTPSASWSPLFSPFRRQWEQQVMALVRVEASQVAPVVEAGESIGPLLPMAATELGLPKETVLVAGAFDQVAAAHGAGARAGEVGVLSCGTAWVLYAVATRAPADPEQGIPVCCHVRAGEWGMVLPFAGGSAYDWWGSRFPAGDESLSGGPLPVFIPHLYGGLAPDWREESRGALLGLEMSHTRGDAEQAVRLGITCEARRNLAAATRLTPLPALRMVGGAARDPGWAQLVSDLLDRPISVPAFPEAACYGAARLAAGKQSADWSMGESRRHQPDPARARALEQDYRRYLAAYRALLEVYQVW